MNIAHSLPGRQASGKISHLAHGRKEKVRPCVPTACMSRQRILVVEDDPALRSILTTILRKNGFDVQSAADGEAGLRIAAEWCPNLIITDINLPKVGGIDMAAAIKKNNDKARILFMTASFGSPQIEKQYDTEFGTRSNCRLMMKPFSRKTVLQMVDAMLTA